MSKKRIKPQISKTAIFTTLTRAIANKEFNNGILGNDYLAGCFLPFYLKVRLNVKSIRARIKHKIPRGFYEYMLTRTAYFDTVFKDALSRNVSQIVLLGAGYDTRPYRYSNLITDTKIFELDTAPMQKRKRECFLKSRIIIPNNVLLVPINFETESLKDALGKAGYEDRKEALFIMEGVTYYLEPETVDATMKVVSSNSNERNTIVFDYILPVPIEKLNDYYGARELHENHLRKTPDEEGKFFIEEGAIESYLAQRGLKILDHLDNDEMEKRFLVNEKGISPGRVTGWFRIVLASRN
jgi:methyltransferase (TIGR00027 family)